MTVSHSKLSSLQLFDIQYLVIILFSLPFPLSLRHAYQRSLSTIKKILDNLPDLSLVYVHCPLLLKFFLRYPELMGRFGHQVLQLWFSGRHCKQTETEEAGFGTSDQLNSANLLLPILKSNSSILLILLVCDFGKVRLLSDLGGSLVLKTLSAVMRPKILLEGPMCVYTSFHLPGKPDMENGNVYAR